MANTKVVSTRIEPAYINILEILAKRAGVESVSEFIRSVLMKLIFDQFDADQDLENKPAAYYLYLSDEYLKIGLEKLKAESPEFAREFDQVKNP